MVKKKPVQQKQRPRRPATNQQSPRVSKAPGQLRIIGGQWRSRRLPVANVPGLRPTPDRVRETLFNWLQMQVVGARCLDLFAGSGALGFEALSREAAEVVLVEKHPAAAECLAKNIATLGATKAQLLQTDALAYLQQTQTVAFDLIFLDPPFRQNFVAQVLPLIVQRRLLEQDGMVYLEYEAELTPDLSHWHVYRETQAGQVISVLLQPK